MVESCIIEAIKDTLGGEVRRILVTGGTGFVGSHVAWLLAEAGQQVTVTGRNRFRIGRRWHPNAAWNQCDIEDRIGIQKLCKSHDVVIHAAAFSSTWGDSHAFRRINVQGTQNVVDACREAGTIRLVYVSSTAIHFEFRDKLDVREDAALPHKFACEYAASKAAAEQVVTDAAQKGLNAVVVRARAVFGPGDNSLLPRLLLAAEKGKLPQIGSGENIVDLTYIGNLSYAICLAVDRGHPGSICTITNEEPVSLWPTLRRMFESLGMPTVRRKVGYRSALMLASAACAWHQLTRRKGEPVLTRYSVGLLAKSQTFSPDAARNLLAYRPLVSLDQGIDRTLKSLAERDDDHADLSVDLELFTTGYTPQSLHLAERGERKKPEAFHALVALIRHPKHGLFLFDTGYAPRFRDATTRGPFRIYGHVSPVVLSESLTIRSQLERNGIAADEIRGIITSHFHADHVAGHRDFPKADIIASHKAWSDVSKRTGVSALRRGFIPSLMPEDSAQRMRTIEHFHDPGIGPFARTHDLFGDGTIRLVELPGHAHGQIGMLVQAGEKRRIFLAADATWTLGALRRNSLPHPLTYVFIDSASDLRRTLGQLHEFAKLYPDIEIVPTHCPEVARAQGFAKIVKQHGEPNSDASGRE